MLSQPSGKYPSSGNIVAIAESTRNAEDLITILESWVLNQSIDMNPFGHRTGLLEGKLGFLIAVGAGGSKN